MPRSGQPTTQMKTKATKPSASWHEGTITALNNELAELRKKIDAYEAENGRHKYKLTLMHDKAKLAENELARTRAAVGLYFAAITNPTTAAEYTQIARLQRNMFGPEQESQDFEYKLNR